jgi:hypothetical protein
MAKNNLYYVLALAIILTLGIALWQWPMFEALLHDMIETKGLR